MPRISIFRPTGAEKASLPLPKGVTRQFVQTECGELELLCAEPSQPQQQRQTPIFFAHGGCGSAYVWLEWMQFFAVKHDVPCYAISYRGHGQYPSCFAFVPDACECNSSADIGHATGGSWYPFFLRMYFTTKEALAGDLAAGINFVRRKERKDVVLVGHSSGGALSQLILSRGIGNIKVQGLALCGAMPCFGG